MPVQLEKSFSKHLCLGFGLVFEAKPASKTNQKRTKNQTNICVQYVHIVSLFGIYIVDAWLMCKWCTTASADAMTAKLLSSVPKGDAVSAFKQGLQRFACHVKTSWARLFITVMNMDKTVSKHTFKTITCKNKITFNSLSFYRIICHSISWFKCLFWWWLLLRHHF